MNIFRSVILVATAGSSLFAQTAPIHVIASNGMKAVILELQTKAEKATGHPLFIEFGTTTSLQQKIESGTPFDVAILTSDVISKLVQENKLAAATRTDLSRTGIGFAIRKGALKPDIATPEALKNTLLGAQSITYAGDGASRPHLDQMFDRLGITAQVKSKIILTQGSGAAMQSVAQGRVSIVLTLISELMTVPGIEIVGPLPADLQNYVSFAAGASAMAANAEAARTVIAMLKAADAAAVYRAKGMEPAGSKLGR